MVQRSGGVDSNTFFQEFAFIILSKLLVFQSKEISLIDLHLILCQSSCLVSTDNCCGTHRLTSVHLANKIIGFQHSLHAIGKTESNGHRQALRNCHNYQRNGNHQRIKRIGNKSSHLTVRREQMKEIDDHAKKQYEIGDNGYRDGLPLPVIELLNYKIEENSCWNDQGPYYWCPMEINHKLANDNQCGKDITDLRNPIG